MNQGKTNLTKANQIKTNQTKTILVVEDSEVNRKILKSILISRGFQVVEAENGLRAIEILHENEKTIALILLDLVMPVMDGYATLKALKEENLLSKIPVIVTTGSESGVDEIKSLEYGASDYIIKPYNPEIVCHRIESILRLFDNAMLINQLEKDRLTGIYNREAFYRHARMLLEMHPEEQYEIVCSNIENFKMINATYGSKIGDDLLIWLAQGYAAGIENEEICGRIGSDIFVILRKSREHLPQDEVAKLYAEKMKDAPVKNVMMQYGIYTITDGKEQVSDMCDCAQMALASIKHMYGFYYAVYDDSMRQKIIREHQLTNYMEEALSEQQFVVYLQPKHDVQTGRIAGAEALVRWIHPVLGFISPGEFIPLFEKNGFITKLDRYIWEKVCQVLHEWIEKGIEPIPISVNASRADFATENLAEKIVMMTEQYKIPHVFLHFEVTESAYTDNPQQIISTVSMLRALGFLIEMDDFGSGYSSLNMLSELPIDILKLDMRFMQKGNDVLPNGKRSILSFIVSLSKWLQLPTVAEGVETADEVGLLKAMGCNYIQGYYYAKPMPVSDFEKYMISQKEMRKEQTGELTKGTQVVPNQSADKPNVLIAEDIEGNRELLKELLMPYANLIMVENGEQAYQYIKENADSISCLLLDLLMPVMDGFQLLDLMREEGYLEKIPVIITSESGADSELRAIRLGADSFVPKPYNAEVLLHHINKAVHEREFNRMIGKKK